MLLHYTNHVEVATALCPIVRLSRRAMGKAIREETKTGGRQNCIICHKKTMLFIRYVLLLMLVTLVTITILQVICKKPK